MMPTRLSVEGRAMTVEQAIALHWRKNVITINFKCNRDFQSARQLAASGNFARVTGKSTPFLTMNSRETQTAYPH
jgi:hypothetical protein